MNVLFLSPYPPYPPTFGGSVRIFSLMRETARRHRVFSLSYEGTLDHEVDRRPFEELCQRIVEVPRPPERKRLRQLLSLASPHSFQRASHETAALQQALDELVAEELIDVVVIEFSQMGYVRIPPGVAVVVDEHNVEWDLLRREAEHAPSALRRLYQSREWVKFREEERALLRRADVVTVTSDRDRALLLQDDPRLPIRVVANGVDTDACAPAPGPGEPGLLVFTGTMHYHPNEQAAAYFVQEILPLVRERVPAARFVGAGGKVPASLAALTCDHVAFTGYVDSMDEWFADAAVLVVPLLVGGGTRFKVVEGLSFQRPVVSTSLGAEGLDVTHGADVLLADDPRAFADAVVELLQDRGRADELAATGRRLVEARYAWRVLGRHFEAALCEAVDRRAAGSTSHGLPEGFGLPGTGPADASPAEPPPVPEPRA